MNRKEHLLQISSEECAEVAHRISKAARFGLMEVQSGQLLNNAERIVEEFNDLVAVMEMLEHEGHLPPIILDGLIRKKKTRIESWLLHSKANGTLTD